MPEGQFLNETPCSSGGSSGGGFGVGGKLLEQNGYDLPRVGRVFWRNREKQRETGSNSEFVPGRGRLAPVGPQEAALAAAWPPPPPGPGGGPLFRNSGTTAEIGSSTPSSMDGAGGGVKPG